MDEIIHEIILRVLMKVNPMTKQKETVVTDINCDCPEIRYVGTMYSFKGLGLESKKTLFLG
jgi:hypothetical protein